MDPIQPPTQSPPQTSPEVLVIQPKLNYLKTIIFSVLIIITLSLIAYLIFQNQKLQKQVLNPQISPTILAPSLTPKAVSSISIPTNETMGWNTYENNYWKITFRYPESLLKPCPNYTTEKEGIRFWGPQFSCQDGHDILYKIGFVGYDLNEYIEPKKPSSIETIVINGIHAQKKTYIYDESDGPLSGLKRSIEIVFNLSNGIVVLQQLGNNINEQKTFDQILSTFKFTDKQCPEGQYARQCKRGPCCCPVGAMCD